MGELLERSNLGELVYGAGLLENYENNSFYFYNKYKESDQLVTNINPGSIQIGRFYFLHYMCDSNWMKYSPIFTVDFKKFGKHVIIYAVNFNFLPIEVRIAIFDKFIQESDFEKDKNLEVDFGGVYKALQNFGFEYAIVEYNLAQIKLVHKINLEVVPRYLYSGHPENKYDPKKLYEIWKFKIKNQSKRHSDMSKHLANDFTKMNEEFESELTSLKDHIKRLKRSVEKYG
jgi:hypothetical protein